VETCVLAVRIPVALRDALDRYLDVSGDLKLLSTG